MLYTLRKDETSFGRLNVLGSETLRNDDKMRLRREDLQKNRENSFLRMAAYRMEGISGTSATSAAGIVS